MLRLFQRVAQRVLEVREHDGGGHRVVRRIFRPPECLVIELPQVICRVDGAVDRQKGQHVIAAGINEHAITLVFLRTIRIEIVLHRFREIGQSLLHLICSLGVAYFRADTVAVHFQNGVELRRPAAAGLA